MMRSDDPQKTAFRESCRTRKLKTLGKNSSSTSGASDRKDSWKEWIISGVYSVCIISQMVLAFLYYNSMGLDNAANVGWLVMAVSGIFGWLPIYTLKKKGSVPEGKSYIHTTALVDTGIYSIIRHPQYFAGILISLATVLISQHWLNAVLLLPVGVGTVLDSKRADRALIEKFGEDYRDYMQRVSGMNPVISVIRRYRRRRGEDRT